MKKSILILWQSLIGLLPTFYLLAIWNKLPQIVPTHFDSNMVANDFGHKSEVLGTILFIFCVSTGVSMLILNLNKVDPKQRFASSNPVIQKISWVITIFMALITLFIIYQTQYYPRSNKTGLSSKYFFALISLLFAVLGNFMNNIKPNYFFGIRTPWALEDDENWRKTHHLSSKLWFFGGLLMVALIVILPLSYTHSILIGGIIPLAIIPFVYSYNLFRQKQKTRKEKLD